MGPNSMEPSNAQRAEILTSALPYIKQYTGKIVVIKYGGNAMTNDALKQAVMRDVSLLSLIGVKVVLVHGGGPEITAMLERLSIPSHFSNGMRVTDEEAVSVVQMVLCGKVNKDLVRLIHLAGGRAVGLSGVDGRLLDAEMLNAELGYVGRITSVNPAPVLALLDQGYIPVISTVGADAAGQVYNINADAAAESIAIALKAESLIAITDTPGILKDQSDETTLLREISVSQVDELIEQGVISGGMIPKAKGCAAAVQAGVKRVFILDGRIPHAIIMEMLTDEGVGTMII